jgi:hypothetical protein
MPALPRTPDAASNTLPVVAMIFVETRSSNSLTGPPQKPSPKSPGPNLTLHDFTMGRTLHYDLFGELLEAPIPEKTRKRILDVQREMNQSLTWTAEKLSLELIGNFQITYGVDPPRPWAPRIGWGFTKVGSDDWSAALVVRFLMWVSTQLSPMAYVRLMDEGDYIVPKYLLIRHGQLALDEAGIDRQRRALMASEHEYLDTFERRVEAGRKGNWFKPVSILEYQDRPEFARIRLTTKSERLHEMTLEDAADRLVFPWQTEGLKSASD